MDDRSIGSRREVWCAGRAGAKNEAILGLLLSIETSVLALPDFPALRPPTCHDFFNHDSN